MEKSIVNEVVSALEAVKNYGQPGFWILLSTLIVLVLVIAAIMYQRIVIKRFQTASKATQENFETLAADLRKRALEQDEGLRKRELEVKERKQLSVTSSHSTGLSHRPRDGSMVSSLHYMNDPQPEGHMASHIERRKFLATLLGFKGGKAQTRKR